MPFEVELLNGSTASSISKTSDLKGICTAGIGDQLSDDEIRDCFVPDSFESVFRGKTE